MSIPLSTSLMYLKGLGPARAELLRNELQLFTFADLLHFFPFRYIDRTRYFKINELVPTNAEVQIIGKIIHIKTVEQKKGKRLVARFMDETGEIELVWFQGIKWIREKLELNKPLVVFGKCSVFNGMYSMTHPELETLESHKDPMRAALQAVYSSTEKLSRSGISNRNFNRWVQQVFMDTQVQFAETFPPFVLQEFPLIDKNTALFNLHFPQSTQLLAQAQLRMKLEELFYIQLQLLSKNLVHKQKIKGFVFNEVGDYFHTFYNQHLPFPLTEAQKRVIKEIRSDLGSNAQMNRLLQGDVGAGKTIVAFLSCLLAMDNGYQACIMAPTEILATQHYHGISDLAQPMGIQVGLLTGSTKTAARREIHQALENGELKLLIGTHALLEDKVVFKNLGLAIIDEQHRFGVAQRAKLWQKNTLPPHILVMTATPIPRTLAMSLYGDLDVSVIDELPPGRKPISTFHRFDKDRLALTDFMRNEIEKGRQIYVVFPLIEGSEKLDYNDLQDGYDRIVRDFPLPKYAISMVHGKLKPAEKEMEMQRFIKGETQIMVATTVIEVGVNVPNASVMIIESAERFGLSQLHQLRGRVGRGAEQSFCILLTSHKLSNDSKIRMQTMVDTNDGFKISEVDLKLRGPGDLLGTQQSGILALKIADIVKDQDLLQQARHLALRLLKLDPQLEMPEHQGVRKAYLSLNQQQTIWNYVS